MKRDNLLNYLNTYLKISEFDDYCPNGLQVEGKENIEKIVTGVSASVELFEKAIETGADTIIVHHGIIWKSDTPIYRGGFKKRLKLLLENEINLFAYHLPLDVHEDVGNNTQLAKILKLENLSPFGKCKNQPIGFKGECQPRNVTSIINSIKEKINQEAIIFPYGPEMVKKIGIISGGAEKEVENAVTEGLDLYLTGEASEYILHYVKEEGIHFIAAGHYATERFGIQALGEHLRNRFNLSVEFTDIPNPI
jgi:dinuclear metal center YbgI/SA1388 family protein